MNRRHGDNYAVAVSGEPPCAATQNHRIILQLNPTNTPGPRGLYRTTGGDRPIQPRGAAGEDGAQTNGTKRSYDMIRLTNQRARA